MSKIFTVILVLLAGSAYAIPPTAYSTWHKDSSRFEPVAEIDSSGVKYSAPISKSLPTPLSLSSPETPEAQVCKIGLIYEMLISGKIDKSQRICVRELNEQLAPFLVGADPSKLCVRILDFKIHRRGTIWDISVIVHIVNTSIASSEQLSVQKWEIDGMNFSSSILY